MGDTTNVFTFAEQTDMLLTYGEVHQNGLAAVRRYREKYPNRRIPNRKTFEAIERRLRENGTLNPLQVNAGQQRIRRTANVKEEILDAVQLSPSTSSRRLSLRLDVSSTSIWRTLREQQLYPYHVTPVQELLPHDYNKRRHFSQWLIRKCTRDPNFLSRMLVTDESCFTRNGITNYRNTHTWDDENPHTTATTHYQHTFSLNVWCGLLGDNLVGPFFLPPRLSGVSYLQFLQDNLPELLQDIPIANRQGMWFMHDGAPAHYSHIVTDYLNTTYGHRWVGRNGPVKWPPRSPDLTPLDYFLWGWMKSLVYSTFVETQEELQNRIEVAAATIKLRPDAIRGAREAWIRRAECCIQEDGGHFEQLL